MKILLAFSCLFLMLNSFAQTKKTTEKDSDDEEQVETKSHAASPGFLQHGIGIGLGQTMLFGDYADHGDDKLAMDLFYQYRASYTFGFLADLHTSTYKKGDGQKTDITAVTANIKGNLFDFDAFAPYVSGGLGMYWPRVTRFQGSNLLESEKHMVIGFNAGLGADLQLNENLSFGLAAFYHQPLNVKQDNQTGVNGSYMRLMATAFLHF